MWLCPRASGLSHRDAEWRSMRSRQSHSDTKRCVYANADCHAHFNTHADGDPDAKPNRYAHADAYTDCDTDSNANVRRYRFNRTEHWRRLPTGRRRNGRS